MNIPSHIMMKKMQRALNGNDNLFTMNDIADFLRDGRMQGHVEGDTWAITQVHDWPQRRAVNIMYLVGSLPEAFKLEPKIEAWAKGLGANLITGVGREGWTAYKTLGWRKIGDLYSKEI
jgi:hypothetical protein